MNRILRHAVRTRALLVWTGLYWAWVAAPLAAQPLGASETIPPPAAGNTASAPSTNVASEQDHDESHGAEDDHSGSRITDEYIPLQLDGFPQRPKPLIELGSPFLGTGRIRQGFTIPGGAVWTPSFVAFGTFRTGVSTLDEGSGDTRTTQWANRLDFFGNLYLTGSERFVFGLRPIHEVPADGMSRFSGYQHRTPAAVRSDGTAFNGLVDRFNFDWDTVSHLFFEGELGELFPGLDNDDQRGLDFGFSVGRQPINFQEGLLINDSIDAVGITRNNSTAGGSVNMRFTGLYSWGQINRNAPFLPPDIGSLLLRNPEADASHLVGGFVELDYRAMTVAIDGIYVRGGEFVPSVSASDGVYLGLSFVGRPGAGFFNTALRVVASLPVGDDVVGNTFGFGDPASRGVLMVAETSWTPHHTINYFYANGFYAVDEYRAAALDPTIPGPLARVGILFEGPGLGNIPSALSPTANESAGGVFGHQRFFGALGLRQQLLLETGGRYSTRSCLSSQIACDPHQFGGAARYQFAVGRRGVIRLDGFAVSQSLRGLAAQVAGEDRLMTVGARAELLVQF